MLVFYSGQRGVGNVFLHLHCTCTFSSVRTYANSELIAWDLMTVYVTGRPFVTIASRRKQPDNEQGNGHRLRALSCCILLL